MKAIFDESCGSEYAHVPGFSLRKKLGLSEQEMADACRYLAGEGLIEEAHTEGRIAPEHVKITHRGYRRWSSPLMLQRSRPSTSPRLYQ